MYEYKCKIIKVVDGDTVDVDLDLGFGVWLRDERVRIMGIDTPESRTSDKVEKQFGLAAKARLISLLGDSAILDTQINKNGENMKGKFGRILGNFRTEQGEHCSRILIREGHAVAYTGGNKDELQAAHLANRKRLVSEGKVPVPPGVNPMNWTEGTVPAPLQTKKPEDDNSGMFEQIKNDKSYTINEDGDVIPNKPAESILDKANTTKVTAPSKKTKKKKIAKKKK